MAILKIARMGHPVLLAKAAEVAEPDAAEIAELIRNMTQTLAAPQVFNSLRLFIYEVPAVRADDSEAVPLTAVINPVVTPLDDEIELGWEGCLSIPGLRAAVPRYRNIRLTGFDASGKAVDQTVSGFHARVVQHENDHLNGVLYPMRMSDFRYFGFNEETLRYPLPLPEITAMEPAL
jgi:peptide deformylase